MAKKLTLIDFITRSNIKHNNFYNYDLVIYSNSKTKVKIICPIHGEFEQISHDHINGAGCSKCGIIKCGKSNRLSLDNFINRSNVFHNNFYDYSLVNYVGNNTKVIIICPIHGKFEQIPNSHLYGVGCSICCQNKKYTNEEFIEKANKIHNNKYNYSLINYINSYTKIKIICLQHGEFEQKPYSHLNGHGCAQCFNFSSKKEQAWLDSLNIPNLVRSKRINICNKRFIFDGYDSSTNTVYEFNGDFWHGNPKVYDQDKNSLIKNQTFGQLYQKTLNKEKFLKDNGFKVITMWETDWDKIMLKKTL